MPKRAAEADEGSEGSEGSDRKRAKGNPPPIAEGNAVDEERNKGIAESNKIKRWTSKLSSADFKKIQLKALFDEYKLVPPTQGKGKQKMMKKEEFARLCAEHAVKNGKTWVETKEFLDRVDIRSESQKASQLSEAILVEADTVAAADAEENTDPTMSVPQRVKDYGDDIADLSFVRVSDFEKTWHVAKLDDVPYTAAQVLR